MINEEFAQRAVEGEGICPFCGQEGCDTLSTTGEEDVTIDHRWCHKCFERWQLISKTVSLSYTDNGESKWVERK